MLVIHKLLQLSAQWDMLHKQRPSTFRNTIIFGILRVVFNLVIAGSLVLLITTFSREMWLPALEGTISQDDYNTIDDILMGFRVISIFLIVISGIIVWLSRSAIKRNTYIDGAESILDGFKEVADDFSQTQQNAAK